MLEREDSLLSALSLSSYSNAGNMFELFLDSIGSIGFSAFLFVYYEPSESFSYRYGLPIS